MFRFENTTAFYLLAAIPILVMLYLWSVKRLNQRKEKFGQINLIDRLLGDSNTKRNRQSVILYLVAYVFLVFALANPQWGFKKEKVKVENSDIFIALDISSSMNATDISPTRLEKAKRFVESLIESRKGDQLGLILFAGNAYLQMPLTSDYAAATLFVKSANTDMAGTQGTAIGEAVDLARRSITDTEKAQRALIIITDGEDHDEDALSKVSSAVDDGWNVFTVGVGTEEGGFVPVMSEGREEFKTDEEGNPVTTRINISLLKEIADAGNGTSYLLENNNDIINDLNTQLEKLQKRAVEVKSFSEYRSYYQYFLGLALFILLLDFVVKSNIRWVK